MTHSKLARLLNMAYRQYIQKRSRDEGFRIVTEYLLDGAYGVSNEQFIEFINLIVWIKQTSNRFGLFEMLIHDGFNAKAFSSLVSNLRHYEKAQS